MEKPPSSALTRASRLPRRKEMFKESTKRFDQRSTARYSAPMLLSAPIPLSTWPLPWADIAREVRNIEFNELTQAQLWSLRYLKHALRQAERGRSSRKRLYGGNSAVPFTNFGSDAREDAYDAALEQDAQEFGMPPQTYHYGDSKRYELIGEVEAQPDRLVLYRGKLLHSGVIPNPHDLTDDPRTGRLTINMFLRGR